MDNDKKLVIVPVDDIIEHGYGAELKELISSLNNPNPVIICKYVSHAESQGIPNIDILSKCVTINSTYGILNKETHYIIIFLLNLTNHEDLLPIDGGVDSESRAKIMEHVNDTFFWRGKAYYILTKPYNMYFTDPQFHTRFMKRLEEFVSELKRIKPRSNNYKIHARFSDPSKNKNHVSLENAILIIVPTATPMIFYTTLSYFSTEPLVNRHTSIYKCKSIVYKKCLDLLDNTNEISSFVIQWVIQKIIPFKSQLFEPRLIYNILDYLRFKPDTK
jgi:hypothetical protein